MEYSDWLPIYKQIIADFKFDEKEDERARDILIKLLVKQETVEIQYLSDLIYNTPVSVFGAGSTLGIELKKFYKLYGTKVDNNNNKIDPSIATTKNKKFVTIAADGATSAFIENNMLPDIIVTDLDGYIPDQLEANSKGALVLVHAHGDNIAALNKWVPKFKGKILGTTQVQPKVHNNVYNFGGFTDGDRAVYLAAHFKAKKINLLGFNFTEVGKYSYKYDSKTKFRKLTWANLLIGMIKEPDIEFFKIGEKNENSSDRFN